MLLVGGNLSLSGLRQHSQKEFWNLPALLSLETNIPIEKSRGQMMSQKVARKHLGMEAVQQGGLEH